MKENEGVTGNRTSLNREDLEQPIPSRPIIKKVWRTRPPHPSRWKEHILMVPVQF